MASTSKTHGTLLHRLRDGSDSLAWEEFFARYGPLIYGAARRRGCSDATAEEVVQEVMLKVFEQKDIFQYDPARGRFRDWLAVLVRNKIAERRRARAERMRAPGGDAPIEAVEPEAPPEGPDAVWEAAFEDALLSILLEVIRREMDPRAYQAFELYTLHEVPGEEVARCTGLSRNGVYRSHKRALRRLRELGAAYRKDGQLGERVKQAICARPPASAERSLSMRVEKTMQARWGASRT
jgi:RNA polymerase sigma factor (sigma-70 family)